MAIVIVNENRVFEKSIPWLVYTLETYYSFHRKPFEDFFQQVLRRINAGALHICLIGETWNSSAYWSLFTQVTATNRNALTEHTLWNLKTLVSCMLCMKRFDFSYSYAGRNSSHSQLICSLFSTWFGFQCTKELLVVWTKFDNSFSVYSLEIILDQIINWDVFDKKY